MSRSEADAGLESARQHNKRVRDFWYHFMVYVFVCGLLVVLDLRGGAGDGAVFGLDWAYWLILFWGFGVAGHGISVFFSDYRAERRHRVG